MKLFGFEVSRSKSYSTVDSASGGGWFRLIGDVFPGAWQQALRVDNPGDVLAFSGVFACVTRIAGDISKLRPHIVRVDSKTGVSAEVEGASPFKAVLRKPNSFQNRIKFIQFWLASKLIHGNAYALKRRDRRGVVVELYLLDPQRVKPLVTESGGVYYQLSADNLTGLKESITVPASEIIHDLMVPLWHPLVGVSPIFACGLSATMGNRIQRNSTLFFQNVSVPAGILTGPGKIEPAEAIEMTRRWKENYGGDNRGKVAVLGNGLKFEPVGAIPAQEAQLIEQLKWTIEDVARCYHMPLYKIGGPIPQHATTEILAQDYYSDCLQVLIEELELALTEGLELPEGTSVELDLDALLRMDTTAMVNAEAEAVKAAIKAPNESRKRLNLPPVKGGDSPLSQQQNYSLEALAKRDAKEDPFGTKPAAAPAPASSTPAAANDESAAAEAAAKAMTEVFLGGLLRRVKDLEVTA